MRLLPGLLFFSLAIWLSSCNRISQDQKPGTNDYRIMNFIVERTHTDTVKKYLGYFIEKNQLRTGFDDLPDGIYSAESPADDFGYTHLIHMQVRDGKLTGIHYDETGADGHSKKDDPAYNEKMKSGSGSCPKESYPYYENELLKKQDLLKIDGLSGSTYSLFRLQLVGVKAINTRKTKKQERTILRD